MAETKAETAIMPDLVSRREAGRLLKMTHQAVNQLIENGDLQRVELPVSTARTITRASVDAFIARVNANIHQRQAS